MVNAKVDTSGLRALKAKLQVTARQADNLKVPFAEAARELELEIRRSIDRQRGMNGERWPPKKGGGKALQSVKDQVFVKATDLGVQYGVEGPGVYHQFGSSRVPRRPFLPTDERGAPLFERGRARKWVRATIKRLREWILNTRS